MSASIRTRQGDIWSGAEPGDAGGEDTAVVRIMDLPVVADNAESPDAVAEAPRFASGISPASYKVHSAAGSALRSGVILKTEQHPDPLPPCAVRWSESLRPRPQDRASDFSISGGAARRWSSHEILIPAAPARYILAGGRLLARQAEITDRITCCAVTPARSLSAKV
jgi:hypothetical protein